MQQRAQSWIQRLYDLCCGVYKRIGNELSVEFDLALWAFWIEPFVMKEVETNSYGYRGSKLLEMLLCAVGSPPGKRNLLKVGQKDCCLAVRLHIYETWYDKLHHLPPRINAVIAAMARQNELERRASRMVGSMAPHPVSTAPTSPMIAEESLQLVPRASDPLLTAILETDLKTGFVDLPQPANTSLSQQSHISEIEVERDWTEIEVTFLSDERVQIRDGKSIATRNYAEFGFQDGRNEIPTRAWQMLRRLAELRGIIRNGAEAHQPWPKVEKRVQEIRRVFREYFGISSDPLPFIEGSGYQAKFKISCGISYRS